MHSLDVTPQLPLSGKGKGTSDSDEK